MLDRLAQRLNCSPTELSVEDGIFHHAGASTGHDYWNFIAAEDFVRDIEGDATPKPFAAYRYVGRSTPRRDLPAKISGGAFVHDMVRPDLLHARILRQPCRGARLASFDEAAMRRAERGDFRVVRVGDFVAFVGADETVAQRAAAVAPMHAKWQNVRQITPEQQEAAWLVGQPSVDRVLGDPLPAGTTAHVVEASYSRPYVAHASMAPSCALAEYRNGHLSVWSHTQGPYPLQAALANVLGLSKDSITVRHAHGAGCYGHNGADDVAVDAAAIALQVPDRCIRVQWRREEEFGFEPVGPAMHITLRAALDDAGKPVDWTAEIWSPTHVQRPSSGGNMLAHEALPTPPPEPRPTDPPEANGGGGTRNAFPLYDFAVRRVIHHLVRRRPCAPPHFAGLVLCRTYSPSSASWMNWLNAPVSIRSQYRLSADHRSPRACADGEAGETLRLVARGPAGNGRGLGPRLEPVQEQGRLRWRRSGSGGGAGSAREPGLVCG